MTTFKLGNLLSDEAVYPHRHTFSNPNFDGLEIHYRDTPDNWTEIVKAAISDDLWAMELEINAVILHRIGLLPLTGKQRKDYDRAVAAMSVEDRYILEKVLEKGLMALILECVGGWNADEAYSTKAFERLLGKFPSLGRAVYQLVSMATLSVDERDLLGKSRAS